MIIPKGVRRPAAWLALWLLAALVWGAGLAASPQPALASRAAALATASLPPPAAQPFADWHLPLPAGKWGISRGPCNSGARFTHECRYYEERCGVDLVPLSGSMEDVPVLAPQAGEVFFEGTRTDGGLMLMVRHADGRTSTFMHLARIVVAVDERVAQGQVLGYAGSTGSSGNPHLHFVVQPNVVERECLSLQGLDDLHFAQGWAVSKNRAWRDLALPEPPALLPAWLPTLAISPALSGGEVLLPARLWLAPGQALTLPVVAAGGVDGLTMNGFGLVLVARQPAGAVFTLPITAPVKPGVYTQTLQAMVGALVAGTWVPISYTVRPALDMRAANDVILINPVLLSPGNWAGVRGVPELCWREEPAAGQAPFQYRAMVVGLASNSPGGLASNSPGSAASRVGSSPGSPAAADSGWISATCWQVPGLGPGIYQWKVFVRDGRGVMNRTNQRPQVFVVRPTK
jgi:murein DD-endopeptidase MepM/ murein hydrolase activator NlpD